MNATFRFRAKACLLSAVTGLALGQGSILTTAGEPSASTSALPVYPYQQYPSMFPQAMQPSTAVAYPVIPASATPGLMERVFGKSEPAAAPPAAGFKLGSQPPAARPRPNVPVQPQPSPEPAADGPVFVTRPQPMAPATLDPARIAQAAAQGAGQNASQNVVPQTPNRAQLSGPATPAWPASAYNAANQNTGPTAVQEQLEALYKKAGRQMPPMTWSEMPPPDGTPFPPVAQPAPSVAQPAPTQPAPVIAQPAQPQPARVPQAAPQVPNRAANPYQVAQPQPAQPKPSLLQRLLPGRAKAPVAQQAPAMRPAVPAPMNVVPRTPNYAQRPAPGAPRQTTAPQFPAAPPAPVPQAVAAQPRLLPNAIAATPAAPAVPAATPAPLPVEQPKLMGSAATPEPLAAPGPAAGPENVAETSPFSGKKLEADESIDLAKSGMSANDDENLDLDDLDKEEMAASPSTETPAARSPEELEKERQLKLLANRIDQTGMKGFCSVTLKNERKLVEALPQFYSVHLSRTYMFASQEAKQEFDQHPDTYAPAAKGDDIVCLAGGRNDVEGSLDHAVWYRGKLYLFSTAENRDTFAQTPSQFVPKE